MKNDINKNKKTFIKHINKKILINKTLIKIKITRYL